MAIHDPDPIWWLIGAHAVSSVPKEPMTIRLFGALLCGAAMMLAAQTDLARAQSGAITGRVTNAQGGPEATGARKNARSDRNNRVQGNFIGTSRGLRQSPADFNADGRRRSNTTGKSSKSSTSDRIGGGSGSRTYFVGTANGGVWRRENNSIFDRWGSSRGRVTGVAVDPSDNRTAVRGKRQKMTDDSNPLPRDRAPNQRHNRSNRGNAQGNPMVHIR
jgi:hypothetical protein